MGGQGGGRQSPDAVRANRIPWKLTSAPRRQIQPLMGLNTKTIISSGKQQGNEGQIQ